MKNTNVRLSVAIPAFNEEKSILTALKAIYSQVPKGYKLDKVCVYSDGSIDKTVALVKKHFKKTIVFDYKKNVGKRRRVNQILKANTADILILMDADISFNSKFVFANMVKQFSMDNKVGLVCAYFKAHKPVTFIGAVSYFGYSVWDTSRTELREQGIRYYSEGGLLALSRPFASTYQIPRSIKTGDDSFVFYKAIQNGFKVRVAKNAVAYLDLAENVSDYIRQMTRFLDDPSMVDRTFPKLLTSQYETMATGLKVKVLMIKWIQNPVVGTAYLLLQGYCKLIAPLRKPNTMWQPIQR